jgi:multicomponent Na+:H+ antiporter subunit E
MLAQIAANLVIALMWALLFTPFAIENFVFGLLLGLIVVYFWQKLWQRESLDCFYPRRLWDIIYLCYVFLREIIKSCWEVMRLVFTPGLKMRSGLIAYETDLKTPLGIILLSNMITVTPGSFVIEISPDNKVLLIHVFDIVDEGAATFKRDVRENFENNIRKVTE